MPIGAAPEFRLIAAQGGAPRRQAEYLVASYAASLAINAIFILLMIWEIDARVETQAVQETPVDVIIEAPPPVADPETTPESSPASAPPPRAAAKESLKGGSSFPKLADEERRQNAPQGEETINGAGMDKTFDGAPQDAKEKRDSEEAPPDRNAEIWRIVPPNAPAPVPDAKLRIAPPGLPKQATVKQPDKEATQDEATIKEKKIECGANAKKATDPSPNRTMRGLVLGLATKSQAAEMIQRTQAKRDMFINPNYIDNIRVFVRVDGAPAGAWQAVLLPAGLSVRAGDRVEFLAAHMDPSMPCHYIPNLVSRVL